MRSVPLFISSTFRDFDRERDALKREVTAYLNSELQPYDACVVPVDLRWGIAHDETDEDLRSRQAMQVCLERINLPGTVFVGLIGDRRGWVPPRSLADAFLKDWGLPAEWNSRSITALECLHAAEVLGRSRRGAVVCIMRDMVGEPPPSFRDGCPVTAELRAELRDLPDVSTIKYEQLYDSATSAPDLSQFIATAKGVLLPLVRAQLPQVEPTPASAYERSELSMWERHSTDYLSRRTDDAVSQNASDRQVVIVGPPGSGRSAAAAEAVRRLRAEGHQVVHYVAEWNKVLDHADALRALLGTDDTNANALTSSLRRALRTGTRIVIDGVELLDDESWNSLRAVGSETSGLVLTVTEESPRAAALNQLWVRDSLSPAAEVSLQPFDSVEILEFLQLRAGSRRQQLPKAASAALAQADRWPSWLELIIGQLDQLGTADYEGLEGRQGALEARLERLVYELSDLDHIVERIRQRCAAAVGESTATAVLTCLALAYDGMTWSELQDGFGLTDLDVALVALLAAGAVVERHSDRSLRIPSLSLRSLVLQAATTDQLVDSHLRLAQALAPDVDRAPACLWHALQSSDPNLATDAFALLAMSTQIGGEVDRAAMAAFVSWFRERAAAAPSPVVPTAMMPLDPISFSRIVLWVEASSRRLPSAARLRLAREVKALAPRGPEASVSDEYVLDLERKIAHMERVIGERPVAKTAQPKFIAKLVRQEES